MIEELTKKCNIIYHEIKGAEQAKSYKIEKVVSQV